jgi:hypothetical protein
MHLEPFPEGPATIQLEMTPGDWDLALSDDMACRATERLLAAAALFHECRLDRVRIAP